MKDFRPFMPFLLIFTALTIGSIVLTNVLDSRSGHLSGFNFEERVGNRRIGSTGHGTSATVSGPGFAAVQRAHPVRHTSMTFERDNAEEVLTDGLTELSFLDTPVAIGSGGFTYDLTFRVPKWGERTPDPSSTHDKGLANTIFASGKLGNLLVLDMDLQSCGQAVQGAPATPPANVPYDTGGLFCLGEIVDQDSGPFSAFPVGDRQRGCTVGDVVTIHYDGTDYKGQVVATQVLSLATTEDLSGTSPNADAPGITQALIDFHQRCDRVIIALEGKTGQDLEDLFDSLGDLDGLTVSHVKHEAIAPPTIYVDGVEGATGFEPTITAVDMNDNFSIHVLTKGVDYIWDPVAGVVYIDRSRLPASDLRLHFRGHVYDTRKTLFAEDICNLNEGFDGMLEGFESSGGGDNSSDISVALAFDNGERVQGAACNPKGAVDDESGFYNWNFPEDGEVYYELDPFEWVNQDPGVPILILDETGFYGAGATVVHPNNHSPFPVGYSLKFPVVYIPVLHRIKFSEVKQVFIDVSFQEGFTFRQWHRFDSLSEPVIDDFGTEVTDDNVSISLIAAWVIVDGNDVSMYPAGDELSINEGFLRITIGEIEYLRKTCDITSLVISAMQSNRPSGARLAIIPIPTALGVPFSIEGLTQLSAIYSAMETYQAQYIEEALVSFDWSTWGMSYENMTLGSMHLKIDKDELIETDYWAEDGGIADSPALDWTAPAP